MAKERREVPRFGALLAVLRGRRSLEGVAEKLRAAGLATFSKSTLKRYEDGRVPDAVSLWALSLLYRRPAGELLRQLGDELQLDPAKLGAGGSVIAKSSSGAQRDLQEVLVDEDEANWLERWRAMTPDGRSLAAAQVDLLLPQFTAGIARPPLKTAQ